MKKKWFALLCSLLMLLPLASPVRATSYPASDVPDQVTEAGQQAIIDYFTKDGETNIPAIAALYDLNVPAAEQVDYILLYAYPHGTSYDGAYTGRVYLIEDAETIRQLCAALSNCGAQAATINPTVTGYDIGDYITEFSLEIHSGKQVSTYNTLYGLDNYLMMLDGKKLGDYTDVPFRCGNRQQQLLPLLELLQTLSSQDKGELVSVLKDSPLYPACRQNGPHLHHHRRPDKRGPRAHRPGVAKSFLYHPLSGQTGAGNQHRALPHPLQRLWAAAAGAEGRRRAAHTGKRLGQRPADGRAACRRPALAGGGAISERRCPAPQLAVQAHRRALCPVSFQRQTGVEDFPAVTDTSRSPYVQKMLGDITVQPGSFERVSKDKTLKGAVSFEADNVSHYQISMTESQLLIQNDSVSYGALFALEDGEKTLQRSRRRWGFFNSGSGRSGFRRAIIKQKAMAFCRL